MQELCFDIEFEYEGEVSGVHMHADADDGDTIKDVCANMLKGLNQSDPTGETGEWRIAKVEKRALCQVEKAWVPTREIEEIDDVKIHHGFVNPNKNRDN